MKKILNAGRQVVLASASTFVYTPETLAYAVVCDTFVSWSPDKICELLKHSIDLQKWIIICRFIAESNTFHNTHLTLQIYQWSFEVCMIGLMTVCRMTAVK